TTNEQFDSMPPSSAMLNVERIASRGKDGATLCGWDVSNRESKVLGYISVAPNRLNVLCDGNSCIVAESTKHMQEYIAKFSSPSTKDYSITKARYGHVLQALRMGAAYSFDSGAFARFRPLAAKDGMDLSHVSTDISAWPTGGSGIPLIRIQWNAK
ncbi:MAG: hypothetical protein AAB288_07000, partial [Acidobacteriota bacterium]